MPSAIRDEHTVEQNADPDRAARVLSACAAPITALLVASTVTASLPDPAATPGPLVRYAPYVILISTALLSLGFARGRALFAVLTLLPAYLAFDLGLLESEDRRAAGTVYGALCIFVPANLAIYALTRERGALNAYGLRRLALIVFECLIVVAVIAEANDTISHAMYWPHGEGRLAAAELPVPLIGAVAMAGAFAIAAACAWLKASIVDAGLAGAIIAFAIACSAPFSPAAFSIYITTAGVIMMFAVLHDSFQMAFHDELTGLPGRRALNQKLMGVMGHYTIAMLDVDHFKSFNDHWGHDIGDQVLKLVASRLRRIERGGTAYRYGGEEFAIVFPGRRLDDVLPAIEKLCNAIAAHRFLIRQSRRQRKSEPVPSSTEPRKWDHVTVSIGVAESDELLQTPDDVLKAADRALYRAKSGGRNRVNT